MNKRLVATMLVTLLLAGFCPFILHAQEAPSVKDGQVSYVSSGNVYVRFESTSDMKEGDTLFAVNNGLLTPALIVKNISSISCVCKPLGTQEFKVGQTFRAKIKPTVQVAQTTEAVKVSNATTPVAKPDTSGNRQKEQSGKKTEISGNVSVASYLNFSDAAANSERMRYTVAFNANHIDGTGLSVETYVTFAHRSGHWDEISENIFNGLKIYGLSANYKFSDHHQVWLGRRINPQISNVGAIDGLQYEFRTGSFIVGAVGGFRPDYTDYSFNSNLLQYGAYLSHDYKAKKGKMQTTLAFMQQTNSGNTDRTFAYLQHVNALAKNLYFFGSAEFDLYNKTFNASDSTFTQDNSPKVSNLYLSLRYRPVRALSFSISYSARQNVIYYESYKDFLATLLEAATVNGFLAQINYSPIKYLTIGVNGSYRDSKNDPRATKSLYGYLSYSRIPGINASGTLSATYLQTGYLSGMIYSLMFNRELAKGKMVAGAGYRFVDYSFQSGESTLRQHMPELSLTWRIIRKLSCSVYYEGTFDNNSTFNRVYINLTKRF